MKPVLTIFFVFASIPFGVEFDGSNDYIDCGTADILQENQPLTISSWIYAETQGEGGLGRIINRRDATSSANGITFCYNVSGRFQFRVSGSTNLDRITGNNAVTTGEWHHVLVAWDGSTTATNVHIYVDGIQPSYVISQNGSSLNDTQGQSTIIGDRHDHTRSWDGQISELAIWRAVLTPTEIALLAKSRVKGIPLQIQPSNLKAYWPLDEFADGETASGAGSIKDLSGNGNHGTPSNGPLGRPEFVLSRPW